MSMITADPKDVPHVEHFAFTPEYLAKAKERMAIEINQPVITRMMAATL